MMNFAIQCAIMLNVFMLNLFVLCYNTEFHFCHTQCSYAEFCYTGINMRLSLCYEMASLR
jgi:hypothetical protein